MPSSRPSKPMWSDKFEHPTIAQLRAGFGKDRLPTFDAARDALLGVPGLREQLLWQGVPWRWTLVYTTTDEGSSNGLKAWAYLIPDPEHVQVCITLTADQVQSIGVKKLKRWVRDGIIFARSVGGICWPTYQLEETSQVEDLLDLIERKQRIMAEGPRQRVEV